MKTAKICLPDEADGLLKPIEFNPYHSSQVSRIAAV